MEVTVDWRQLIKQGLEGMLKELGPGHHTEGTPDRVVRMYEQSFQKPETMEEARAVLQRDFKHKTDISQMISVNSIQFVSWCAHHLVPILCVGHFAYLPTDKIVGLSKVVRLVEIVAARPQVQEVLTDQVASIFQEEVDPLGCGFVVDAQHMCMIARGVQKAGVWVRTSSLRGRFLSSNEVKQEFLGGVPKFEA